MIARKEPLFFILLVLLIIMCPWITSSWTVVPRRRRRGLRSVGSSSCSFALFDASSNQHHDGNEDDLIDFETNDWRDFRAKLVLGGDMDTNNVSSTAAAATNETTTTLSSSWAYESTGSGVIEKGSVLLSNLEQDFGYGIKQQYFHKCVILVLHHDDHDQQGGFTQGIILNRPTNLLLRDNDFCYPDGTPLENIIMGSSSEPSSQWRVWYGGEVQGLASDNQEFFCLHSLQTDMAKQVSEIVIKDIQWTTLEGARKLIEERKATSNDFWLFCGYAGWAAGQLMNELKRGDWYMVATDSATLWRELQGDTDPQQAGIDAWSRLMCMIGRKEETDESKCAFDDLMLYEWAKENLMFNSTSEEEEPIIPPSTTLSETISAGTLLRGSSREKSPFLLSDQEFHKSIVLVTQDEKDCTIGLLLNRPLPKVVECRPADDDKVVRVPMRYGGKFGIKGDKEKPIFWLYNSNELRAAKIGSPLGAELNRIWKCSKQDVTDAIKLGIASEKDFISVNGFTVWPKASVGTAGASLSDAVTRGDFELVPSAKTNAVWDAIVSQEVLSAMTLDKNLLFGNSAWSAAAGRQSGLSDESSTCMSNKDLQLAALCDDALRCWIAAFLLGEPLLRHSESAFG